VGVNRYFQSPIPSSTGGLPLARFDSGNDVLPGGGSVAVVEAFGELDLATVGEFARALQHSAESIRVSSSI